MNDNDPHLSEFDIYKNKRDIEEVKRDNNNYKLEIQRRLQTIEKEVLLLRSELDEIIEVKKSVRGLLLLLKSVLLFGVAVIYDYIKERWL